MVLDKSHVSGCPVLQCSFPATQQLLCFWVPEYSTHRYHRYSYASTLPTDKWNHYIISIRFFFFFSSGKDKTDFQCHVWDKWIKRNFYKGDLWCSTLSCECAVVSPSCIKPLRKGKFSAKQDSWILNFRFPDRCGWGRDVPGAWMLIQNFLINQVSFSKSVNLFCFS